MVYWVVLIYYPIYLLDLNRKDYIMQLRVKVETMSSFEVNSQDPKVTLYDEDNDVTLHPYSRDFDDEINSWLDTLLEKQPNVSVTREELISYIIDTLCRAVCSHPRTIIY